MMTPTTSAATTAIAPMTRRLRREGAGASLTSDKASARVRGERTDHNHSPVKVLQSANRTELPRRKRRVPDRPDGFAGPVGWRSRRSAGKPGRHGGETPMADEPRLPWGLSDRPVPRLVLRPLQEFLSTSTAGGVLLLGAAALALAWANSPWRVGYERLWTTTVSVGFGRWGIEEDLRYWANEGLMALFFLVAGLEIKRELLTGELRDRRSAVLPVVAAVGGMAV